MEMETKLKWLLKYFLNHSKLPIKISKTIRFKFQTMQSHFLFKNFFKKNNFKWKTGSFMTPLQAILGRAPVPILLLWTNFQIVFFLTLIYIFLFSSTIRSQKHSEQILNGPLRIFIRRKQQNTKHRKLKTFFVAFWPLSTFVELRHQRQGVELEE